MKLLLSAIALALAPVQAAPAEAAVPTSGTNSSQPFVPSAKPLNVVVPLSGGLAQLATPSAQPTTAANVGKTGSIPAPQNSLSRHIPSIMSRPTRRPKPSKQVLTTTTTSQQAPRHTVLDNPAAAANALGPKGTHRPIPLHKGEMAMPFSHGPAAPSQSSHADGKTVPAWTKKHTGPHKAETKVSTRTRPHHVVVPTNPAGQGAVTTKPSQAVATPQA